MTIKSLQPPCHSERKKKSSKHEPLSQRVLSAALSPNWSDNFASFERTPFAAASIGQVHSAVLAASASPTGREERVAVKIQFPGVRESIESDLGYIRMLLTASRVLPRGLFLDKSIKVRDSLPVSRRTKEETDLL